MRTTLARGGIGSALALALGLSLIVSAPVSADTLAAGERVAAAPRAGMQPPSAIDARFATLAGAAPVGVLARIHPLPGAAQRVVVQVAVRPRSGGARVLGPERSVGVGETSPMLRVDPDGTVSGTLPLTPAQREELRAWRADVGDSLAAREVSVLLRHEIDSDPARPGYDDLGTAGDSARLSGEPLALPHEVRDSPGTVWFENTTPNPVVLLSGPAQCMYDTVYAWGTLSDDGGGSYLGSANGTLLYPGQRIGVKVDKDSQTLDGKESNGQGTDVIADYQQAIASAYKVQQASGDSELPQILVPDSSTTDWSEMRKESALFVLGILNWVTEGAGVTETLLTALGLTSIVETFGFALDVAVDFIEIVGVIVELFENGCGGAPGYILIGATDAHQPWRSTSQTYSWNSANPIPAEFKDSSGDKVPASPAFNGLVMNTATAQYVPPVQPAWIPILQNPALNNDRALWYPDKSSSNFSWTFTEPDTAVTRKSTISIAGRVVSCGNPQLSSFVATMNAQGIPAVGMWKSQTDYGYYDMGTGAAIVAPSIGRWPSDYFVGEAYVFNGHSQMAVYATSGVPDSSGNIDWTSIMVPPGATQVAIPASTNAAWVKCAVQVPEMMTGDLVTDRTILLGTNVPSDTVPGPDFPS